MQHRKQEKCDENLSLSLSKVLELEVKESPKNQKRVLVKSNCLRNRMG